MLYGTETLVDFDYKSNSGSRWGRTDSFEGVIGSMQRHFSETDSESKLMAEAVYARACVILRKDIFFLSHQYSHVST